MPVDHVTISFDAPWPDYQRQLADMQRRLGRWHRTEKVAAEVEGRPMRDPFAPVPSESILDRILSMTYGWWGTVE